MTAQRATTTNAGVAAVCVKEHTTSATATMTVETGLMNSIAVSDVYAYYYTLPLIQQEQKTT